MRYKKQVGMFLISYKSKNVFLFSSFYDPFYCNMICFTYCHDDDDDDDDNDTLFICQLKI